MAISNLLFAPPPPKTVGGRMPSALSINELHTCSRSGLSSDLRTLSSLGVFPISILTSVRSSLFASPSSISAPIPIEPLRAQLSTTLGAPAPKPDATKIGFAASFHAISAISEAVQEYKLSPIIIDPELVNPSGQPLMTQAVTRVLAPSLFPLADLLVLNASEAELFTGRKVYDRGSMREANNRLRGDLGLTRILICGGRIQEHAVDLFFDENGCVEFGHDRIHTQGIYGKGSTFSALITGYVARGFDWLKAIELAKEAISTAILKAPNIAPDLRQVDTMIPALNALMIDPTPLSMIDDRVKSEA